MPISQITEHCLQIRRFNCINCYLVRQEDGLTLIDTALGAARLIIAAAAGLGQPIRRVLLTHAHADHVGSLDSLKQRIPDVEVSMSGRDAQLLAEAATGIKPAAMKLLADEPQTPIKGGFKKVKTTPDNLLSEGDRVGSLRVVNTPGHTPGHVSFLDERDGSLFAGDALVTFKEIRLPFDPVWFFPLTKAPTWHAATAFASAERLAQLQLKRVLAGHGPMRENVQTELSAAVQRARRQLVV